MSDPIANGATAIQGLNYLVVMASAFVGMIGGAVTIGFWTGGLKGRVDAVEADNIKCASDRKTMEARINAQLKTADDRLWTFINNFGDFRATVATKDDIAMLRQEMIAELREDIRSLQASGGRG